MITFAKIVLFEEIVDHFNSRVAADSSIDPFIRELNSVHHRDESRHISFGREMVLWLYEGLKRDADEPLMRAVDEYLRGYLLNSVQMLYNPTVYQDAALPGDAYARRRRLIEHKGRLAAHMAFVRKPEAFLLKHGMISKPIFAAA